MQISLWVSRRISRILSGGMALIAILVMLPGFGPPIAAQPGPTLRVTAPSTNATVSSPVTISVQVQNANLRAADLGDPTSHHLHYFVDVDPATVLQPGQPIPTGQENIIHTADTSQTLNLGAGQHTIWIVLTDVGHIPLTPGVQTQVTFTVSGAPSDTQSRPESLPRTGTGGYRKGPPGSWLLVLVTGAGLVVFGTGARLWWLRRTPRV